MTVLAEVVDESVKGMELSLVSKAEQEKVGLFSPFHPIFPRPSLLRFAFTSLKGPAESRWI